MKYRKKPIVIEAVQYMGPNKENDIIHGTGNIPWDILEFTNAHAHMVGSNLSLSTLEGVMTVSPGDYIIKGIKGEFYPCKPDIFENSYEMVEN